MGSRGDSYDNALAETVIGLYKAELIHPRGPWRGVEDVEHATLEWVHWYNTQRLQERLGLRTAGGIRSDVRLARSLQRCRRRVGSGSPSEAYGNRGKLPPPSTT